MKKYGRTIIVIAVLVALGLGYYYYLANKDTGKDATDIAADTSEVSVLISKDIMANYPESPKDVVNLYARITKAYYDTSLTDEQIEALGKMLLILRQIPVRFLCLFQKILWLIIRNHLRM